MQIPSPAPGFWSRSRWLARLSMSFLIVAAWLAYVGYHGAQTHEFSRSRSTLCYVAAIFAFSLFLMGTRERHRPRDD